jgi:hypothetical protein
MFNNCRALLPVTCVCLCQKTEHGTLALAQASGGKDHVFRASGDQELTLPQQQWEGCTGPEIRPEDKSINASTSVFPPHEYYLPMCVQSVNQLELDSSRELG